MAPVLKAISLALLFTSTLSAPLAVRAPSELSALQARNAELEAEIRSYQHLLRRQLAGEGAACDSILSSTDNGVGYGTEGVEDNLASTISGDKGSVPSTGTGGAAPPPKRSLIGRQADKISNGANTLISAAGAPQVGEIVGSNGDTVDGQLTSDAANAGAQIGNFEETTLENAGGYKGGKGPSS